MSPEIAVLLRPSAAYRQLAPQWPAIRPIEALRRPALAAVVAGAAVSLTATGRVTVPLLFSTTLYWSFAFIWQVVAAMVATRGDGVPLGRAQRLDLFFAGSAPWSIWLLTAAAWSRLLPGQTDLYVVLLTASIPALWTARVVHGFCEGALGLSPRQALVRMLAHQALIWAFAFVYIAWAVALRARAAF